MNTYCFKRLVVLFIFAKIFIFFLSPNISATVQVGKNAAVGNQQTLKELYAVVIDSGSTGSRVLAYNFTRESNGSLTVNTQLYKFNHQGLSEFINKPEEGVETIRILINQAKNFVPNSRWAETPILLRATAGLRKFDDARATRMLNKLKDLVDGSGFLRTKYSVAIMNGKDEGVYSWFTVNLLQNNLSGIIDRTNAVLDLGGASVEITYHTDSVNDPENCIKSHDVLGKQIKLYSKSYNLGLLSGRVGTFTASGANKMNVTSPCFHKNGKNFPLVFGSITYYVTGESNTGYKGSGISFDDCKRKIESFVVSQRVNKPTELQKNTIVAISYFFDIAEGLVLAKDVQEGHAQIKAYYEAAQKACAAKDFETDKEFICMDLIYIAVLLEKGFGLHQNTEIYLVNTIRNFEISWALGFAYNYLLKGDSMMEEDKDKEKVKISKS